MQLIKRTTLHYQEGSSDKVYEVDLCQTGEDRYAVNFRYGRRGSNLKEGVKTEQAVPLVQAQKIFDKLVAEKVNKGYRDVSTLGSQTPAPKAVRESSPDARKQAILNRPASQNTNKWPLERAIWRAGELKIREAVPLLLPLIGTGDALRDYCIVWSLGWCGDREISPTLAQLYYKNTSTPDFVRRIAWEALLKLSDEATKARLRTEKIAELPTELREKARNGSADEFTNALREYLEYRLLESSSPPVIALVTKDYQRFAVLDIIYQIDNEYVRPALLEILHAGGFYQMPFSDFGTFSKWLNIAKMPKYLASLPIDLRRRKRGSVVTVIM